MQYAVTRCVLAMIAVPMIGIVHAQMYPAKPVRFIVPWPPGGGADTISRMMTPKMSEALGQQVVIDNRVGAAGNIGAEIAAKSAPDGYTIVSAYAGTHAVNPSLYRNMPFRESDFAAIIWLASVPQFVVVHPSLPVKSIRELIALAKAKPGQLNFASAGAGAINHLTGELFNHMTGTKIVHVPYKGGGPAAIALLSGEIEMIFGEPATLVHHVKSGRVRGIAVTSARRSLAMPEFPTVAEAGVPGYEVVSWHGVLAPAAVPKEVIARLNAEFNRVIAAPEMKTRMLDQGFEPVGGTPEQFGEHIRAEIAKWAPIIKATGLKVD
jgi:tripartite-type tricarboxylate transporter receptor subunit TctC